MRVLLLALLATLSLGGGCASIVSGTHEEIWLSTDRPGEVAVVDGVEHEMPCYVSLLRKQVHQIEFPNGRTVLVQPDFWGNPVVFGNLITIPVPVVTLIALLVDVGTGASKNLEPDEIVYSAWDGLIYNGETWEVLRRPPADWAPPEKRDGDDPGNYAPPPGPQARSGSPEARDRRAWR